MEALVVRRGMQVRYAPDAIVYNSGPTTLHDFVKQRRRNHAGHLYLKHKYGYKVSSLENSMVVKIALKEIWGAIRLLYVLGLLAVLEGWARLLGWYDFAIRKERHQVWDMAWTQKVDVGAQCEEVDDASPVVTAPVLEQGPAWPQEGR